MRVTALILTCGLSFASAAQEMNFGVHVNPVITAPFLDGASQYDNRINVSKLRVGANIGVDANLVFRKWRLQTGANIMHKSVSFYQRTHNISSEAYTKDIVESISLEVPLLFAYKLATRNKKTYYHVYGVGGAAYEWNTINGISSKTGASGYNNASVELVNHNIIPVGQQSSWVNLVAGFNINAIIEGVGLVDYGITYHLPLSNAAGYSVATDVNAGVNTINYRGTFYPRMSHINFKLCYYFLSLRDGGVKKYSKV